MIAIFRSHTHTLPMVNISNELFATKMHILIFSEFSSFQFPSHIGHGGAHGGGGLGNQTPIATRHNKKKGFKQNLYKSGANF